MDNEVKQRNRRRKRAQRMQAQRESKANDGDSGEDESPIREKPQRPPNRRKKSKEPVVEEDIVDGFAILGFRTYEDLENVIKLATKAGVRRLTGSFASALDEKLKSEKEQRGNLSLNNHHISAHPPPHSLTLSHDPGTSDDSGRASERLTGSSVAPRDPDSSRDRLSDASSRCSSGKGYICDSEGEDDKGSDAGSVLFASTPAPRKLEFPSALSISNGDSAASPVPAPTPPSMAPPTPSPAPAALPPPQQQYTTPPSAATAHSNGPAPPPPPRLSSPPPVSVAVTRVATPPSSVPVTMPQPAPAAAPAPVVHLPPALDSSADVNHGRTDSPAVATSANAAVAPGSGQYPAFPSLYAPYAVHSPYTAPSPAPAPATLTAAPPVPTTTSSPAVVSIAATVAVPVTTTTSHRDAVTTARTHSPRGHSPTRERDSYSSNVSSLSRGSVTPFSTAAPSVTVSSSLAFSKPTPTAWPVAPTSTAATSQLSPATSVPRPTPPLSGMHPFPAPMFAPPLPPPVSTASPLGMPTNSVPNPNPFSAESLFQSNQADMLRRELDNRFLASQDRTMNVGPPPYLRAEMHQHQHHHTHVHQHTTPLLPPPPASSLFPAPLRYVNEQDSRIARANTFKDIPKMGSVDSPFYRQNLGISSYPGYSPGLLHPGLGGPTPFVPPNHLPTFQPKKSGKWNAMHVRVAWEIYHHQQKQQSEVKAAGVNSKADLLRPPSHMFPGSLIHSARPHELAYPPTMPGHRPPTFDPQPHPGSLFTNPATHLVHRTAGSGISPFTRYGTAFNAPGSPFGMSPFPSARDLPPLGPLHDPWSRLQRTVPGFPAPVPQSPWGLKPDPAVLERREAEERERERERERLRREREERERREREEKQRKQLEQQQQERERERREKERREMERREMERERERERERMLHQQRIAESNKQAAALAARDRSPLRNGSGEMSEVRVKEEPRTKDEDVVLLGRTDHRYHPYLNRHPSTLPPHSVLDRSRSMLPPSLAGPPLPSHYPPPPPASHWPSPDPYAYRFDHLRYNPLMEAAMRAEEERAKMFSAYAHPAHLRAKDPGPPPTGLLHMRPGTGPGPPPHKLCATPPTTDLHKKDDSSQSR